MPIAFPSVLAAIEANLKFEIHSNKKKQRGFLFVSVWDWNNMIALEILMLGLEEGRVGLY
ncbi:hypothetical protein RchiOBHm_Chr2g0085431 [Rosa chinensis]|uniref:Uncharacterized protein n=1 Tax=Rosa chinensis TaxID=74649 RepID=A0A2P6RI41_ROSCH|nr:hypothetical protein RchiOBHm_Chr2g0085431 [Rosa chinensis]